MRPQLPQTVGDLSRNARRCLLGGDDRSSPLPSDPFDLDAQLAWYMLNDASFAGWDGVNDDAEWFPAVVQARRRLEAWFKRTVSPTLPGADDARPSALVREILGSTDGPSVSRYLRDHGTLGDLAESLMLRAPYQFKEADPHTFAIPRLSGTVKRALCEIQSGEYGVGHRSTHAELFTAAAAELGVGPDDDVIDRLPGVAFATSNLVSMGGLNRADRGIVIGQLALFEMDSVAPNGVMVEACDRLGVSPVVRRFFDVHVMADAEHEVIAEQAFLHEYPLLEPDQVDNLRFGIRAQAAIDAAIAQRAIGAWSASTSALRAPSDVPHGTTQGFAA